MEPERKPVGIGAYVRVKPFCGDMTPGGLDAQVEILVAGQRVGYMLAKYGAKFCWLSRRYLLKNNRCDFTPAERIEIVQTAREQTIAIRDRWIAEAETLRKLENGGS